MKSPAALWRAVRTPPSHSAPSSRVRDRLRLEWMLLAVCMLLLGWWLAGSHTLQRGNLLVQDASARLQHRAAAPEVVLVAIDDASLATIGRWPWRRAIHAQLVRQLSAQDPLSIGLDILFTEPDLDHPTDDALLAAAMADSGRVVLPVSHDVRGQLQEPLPLFSQAAASLGHVQLSVDIDGGVRRFPPYVWKGANNITAAQAPAVERALSNGTTAPTANDSAPTAYAHLGVAMLCLAQPQSHWCQPSQGAPRPIAFAAGYPAFPVYSYIDVVRGTIPSSAFRGKHVVVGTSAHGLSPTVPTPSRAGVQQAAGMALVAHILHGALQDSHPVMASSSVNRAFNLIPLAMALVALALLGPSAALLVCGGLWVGTLALSTLAPLWWQVILSPAAALLLIATAYPLWSWRRLNAAAHFLEQEMRDLGRNGVLPQSSATGLGNDMLGQRIQAVEHASRQLRELHHFVSESLLQLPSPTLVCDTQGRILLANSAAHRYAQTLQRPLTERQDIRLLLEGAQERETQQPLFDPTHLSQQPDAFQREGTDASGRHLLLVGRPFSAPPTTGWLLTLVDITKMRQAMAQRDQAMHFISHDIRAPIGAIVTLMEMERSFGTSMPYGEARQPSITSHAVAATGAASAPTGFLPHAAQHAGTALAPAAASAVSAPVTAAKATVTTSPTESSASTAARIERYARTALAMADDFVHLARAQQQPPRQEEVELNQLVDQALDDSWAAAQAKTIDLDWMPQEEEALITGDASQLRRVLVNMLSNAIKYSPERSTVHISLEERPSHWVVSLRDEGDGISAEQQATLFAPFTRLQQHENSRIQGVGLGLAFVHTVMQRHGAVIEIDSAPGQGSTFRLVFAKRAQ